MTNAQIIFNESQRLADEGKIGYTGKEIKVINLEGEEVTMKEVEPIHTYQTWKKLGFQVKKGQKAIDSFPIWKHVNKKVEVETEDGNKELVDRGTMFMKLSAFFSFSQVEKIAK